MCVYIGFWWLGKRGTKSPLKGFQEASHQNKSFLAWSRPYADAPAECEGFACMEEDPQVK